MASRGQAPFQRTHQAAGFPRRQTVGFGRRPSPRRLFPLVAKWWYRIPRAQANCDPYGFRMVIFWSSGTSGCVARAVGTDTHQFAARSPASRKLPTQLKY